LGSDLVAKQVDSIDELVACTSPGQAAIILWDARGHSDPAAVLARLHAHSVRFAILALDDASTASAWTLPLEHRQVVAMVALPMVTDDLAAAIASARDEASARAALPDAAGVRSLPSGRRKTLLISAGVFGVVVLAGMAVYLTSRRDVTATPAPILAVTPSAPVPIKPGKAGAGLDDGVDMLIEKAQQAMLERHFIDPAEGSALSLYRQALNLNPSSGEARQGIQRVAEILFARAQSALDERKFDVALQSLETARSIDADDSRLAALDERIASVRAELGPAQIQAALAAQNFERATQLIDDAARAKSLNAAKLAQLRDEVRRRREDTEVTRFVALIDTRLQQDRLIDPPHDNAAYYMNQARAAGVGAAALQAQVQEFIKRGTLAVHSAIEQHRYGDADRLVAELRTVGAAPATISGLQRDMSAAHGQQTHDKSDQQQYLDLARARLGQGNVIEPDNDSALFYVNQLRAADPQNGALGQISGAVQTQILDRARAALDAGELAKTETLLHLASGLGFSTDLSALGEKLLQAKLASVPASTVPSEVPEPSLVRLNRLQPEYPRFAASRNQEGWVELTYVVTAEGGVGQVKVFNASPPGVFDAAAVQAIARLRYKPFLQGGKAVAVSTKVRVVFRVTR
jgi:TonB family protein